MFLLFLVGEGRKLGKSQEIGRSWRGLGVITIRMSADTIRLWADRLMGAADTIRKMTERWRGFLGKIVQEKRIYVKDCSFFWWFCKLLGECGWWESMDFQEGRGRFDFFRRQSAARFCQVLRTFDRERQRREGQRGGRNKNRGKREMSIHNYCRCTEKRQIFARISKKTADFLLLKSKEGKTCRSTSLPSSKTCEIKIQVWRKHPPDLLFN